MLYNFYNLGFFLGDVPRDILADVRKEIRTIQNDFESAEPANHILAGHIDKEFILKDSRSVIEPYVMEALYDYDREFSYLKNFDFLDRNVPIGLGGLWVNFQQKNEFNPLHGHSGIMSFVLWTNIPYDIEDEYKNSPGSKAIENKAASFQFVYTDVLGGIHTHTLPVDKSYEGKLLMFPNKLMHTVTPFTTSDDYRISVSGNLTLKV